MMNVMMILTEYGSEFAGSVEGCGYPGDHYRDP